MALIKCPECGKDISDKASECNGCGYPLGDSKCYECGSRINNNDVSCSSCGAPLKEEGTESCMVNIKGVDVDIGKLYAIYKNDKSGAASCLTDMGIDAFYAKDSVNVLWKAVESTDKILQPSGVDVDIFELYATHKTDRRGAAPYLAEMGVGVFDAIACVGHIWGAVEKISNLQQPLTETESQQSSTVGGVVIVWIMLLLAFIIAGITMCSYL